MSISVFENNLPDEIIVNICDYLSWSDIFTAFYNLNSRLNRTISGHFKHVSFGDYCHFKQFQYSCSLLLSHRSFLFDHIKALKISNRGSPLAAKYFLSHIPIQQMIHLEKLTLVAFTPDEILLYLDVIDNAEKNTFQHLVKLHLYQTLYINTDPLYVYDTPEALREYHSYLANRILTGNSQQLQSIIFDGYNVSM